MNMQELSRKIDTLYACDNRMKRFNGYILIKKGEELFSKGYGIADYSTGASFNQDTIFLIGSLTKVFTSTCIMMLEAQGLLNTDDCLEKYLPQYTKASKVTIGQLLSHSSGIPDYWNRIGISSIDYNGLIKMIKPNLGGYGYGCFIENDKAWHGGDMPGFSVRMTRFLTNEISIIMLCNTDGKKEAHMGHFEELIEDCLSKDK